MRCRAPREQEGREVELRIDLHDRIGLAARPRRGKQADVADDAGVAATSAVLLGAEHDLTSVTRIAVAVGAPDSAARQHARARGAHPGSALERTDRVLVDAPVTVLVPSIAPLGTEIALAGPVVDLDASATPWVGAIGEGDVVWFWSGLPREGELPPEQRSPRRLGPDGFGPIRGLSVAADSMVMVQSHLSFVGVRHGGLDGSGRSYDDVFLWGVSVFGPTLPGPLACSSSHCCADHIPSGLMCWGAWAHGALAQRDQEPPPIYGLNSSVQGLEPTDPEGHVFLRGLAASDRNATCIIREDDGELYCWGHAAMNGLGAETDVHRPAHVAIDDGRPLTGLYGEHHFCVRLGERALRCWGEDSMNALGGIDGADPQRPSPVLGFE